MTNPLICALDNNSPARISEWVDQLSPHVGMFKLGLEFFCSNGPDAIRRYTEKSTPIFLDLKLHDIPNTVASSMRALAPLGASLTTLHALGGLEMMKAAVAAYRDTGASTKTQRILAVTVLTSMDQKALHSIGIQNTVEDTVLTLVDHALAAGVDGIVCSPHEIAPIRKRFGKEVLLVTPGIRTEPSSSDDQKRTMSASDAVKAGANYIVVGRPITQSKNPVQAAQSIVADLT